MPRILLVNDSAQFLSSLASLLVVKGYNVVMALGGHEALLQLRDGRFDLMVLDIAMPALNGLDVLRQLPDASPPVIITTGDPILLPADLPARVRHVVPKEVEDVDYMPRLLAAIEEVVGVGTADVSALKN